MTELGPSGSVGTSGEQSPGVTRPNVRRIMYLSTVFIPSYSIPCRGTQVDAEPVPNPRNAEMTCG